MAKKFSLETVLNKLKIVHNEKVIMDVSTFKNTYTKTRFTDKDFGEWWAYPKHVLKGQGHRGRACNNHAVSLEEIKKRIHLIHGDCIIVIDKSYINLTTKATFVDKDYGSWITLPYNVVGGSMHPKRARLIG